MTHRSKPPAMVGPNGGRHVDQVLHEIRRELVRLLGDELAIDDVRVDADLFDTAEPVVAGRWLDSMDVVQIVAALEERFDVGLAEVLTGDEPITLVSVAHHIARSRP